MTDRRKTQEYTGGRRKFGHEQRQDLASREWFSKAYSSAYAEMKPIYGGEPKMLAAGVLHAIRVRLTANQETNAN